MGFYPRFISRCRDILEDCHNWKGILLVKMLFINFQKAAQGNQIKKNQ